MFTAIRVLDTPYTDINIIYLYLPTYSITVIIHLVYSLLKKLFFEF